MPPAKRPQRGLKPPGSSTDALEWVFPTPSRRQLEQSQARRSLCRFFLWFSFSYWPSCDYSNDAARLELKDNLELSTANGSAAKLMSVTIALISSDFKI